MKRYEFIERTLFLIRSKLEENLPDEADLDEMIEKSTKLIDELYK
jgi:hypothetical protein